jgi:paraquat-inducible protein A
LHSMIACHDCDLLQRIPPLPDSGTAVCPRCGAALQRTRRNSLERTLALTLAGLALFAVANTFPFLAFKLEAQIRETTLLTGILTLYRQGLKELAVLVMLTTVVVPLVQLLGTLYVLLPLKFNRQPPMVMHVFRWVRTLQPWSMMEVFLIGILVSIVKLAKMAKIVPGVAVFAFLALILVMAASASTLDPHVVWDKWRGDR